MKNFEVPPRTAPAGHDRAIRHRTDITPETLPSVAALVRVSAWTDGDAAGLRIDRPTLIMGYMCGNSDEVRVSASGDMSSWFTSYQDPLDDFRPRSKFSEPLETAKLGPWPLRSPVEILGLRPGPSYARQIATQAAQHAMLRASTPEERALVPALARDLEDEIQGRVTSAWEEHLLPLLPPAALVSLHAMSRTCEWRYEVYDRLRRAEVATFEAVASFLARHALLGASVVVGQPGWDAVAGGSSDHDAFVVARDWAREWAPKLEAKDCNYPDPVNRWILGWTPAHFRALAGNTSFLDMPAGRELWYPTHMLPQLPPEWMPGQDDGPAMLHVLRSHFSAAASIPSDRSVRMDLRGSKGDWSHYAARMSTALGGHAEDFGEFNFMAHKEGGALRRLTLHLQRDVVAPLALLHPDVAPTLHAMVRSGLACQVGAVVLDVGPALTSGMDLPSRAALFARYGEARPDIVRAVARYAATGTTDSVTLGEGVAWSPDGTGDVKVIGLSRPTGGGFPPPAGVRLFDFGPPRVPTEPGWVSAAWTLPASTFEGVVVAKVTHLMGTDPVEALSRALGCPRDGVGDALLARHGLLADFAAQLAPSAFRARVWGEEHAPPCQPSFVVSASAVSEVLRAWEHVLPRRFRVDGSVGTARAFEAAYVSDRRAASEGRKTGAIRAPEAVRT